MKTPRGSSLQPPLNVGPRGARLQGVFEPGGTGVVESATGASHASSGIPLFGLRKKDRGSRPRGGHGPAAEVLVVRLEKGLAPWPVSLCSCLGILRDEC